MQELQKPKKGYKTVKSLFGKYEGIPEDWEVVDFKDFVFFQEGPGLRTWQFWARIKGQDWDTVEFGQLIEDLRYGTSVKCTTDRNGIPVLRIPNIIHGNIDFEDLKYAVLPDSDIQRYGLREGDIIFIRTNGNREYVGRCAVYHQNSNIHAFASYLIRVTKLKSFSIKEVWPLHIIEFY